MEAISKSTETNGSGFRLISVIQIFCSVSFTDFFSDIFCRLECVGQQQIHSGHSHRILLRDLSLFFPFSQFSWSAENHSNFICSVCSFCSVSSCIQQNACTFGIFAHATVLEGIKRPSKQSHGLQVRAWFVSLKDSL